jgi:hypothetical protein
MVHMSPAGTTAAAETTAVDEKVTADNFSGAWDFLGDEADIPYSNAVLALRDAKGTVTSAVPFVRSDVTDPDKMPRDFPADVQALIDAGLWAETCAPSPCSYTGNLGAITVDWAGAGTDRFPALASGASVARKADGKDDHKKSDWQPVNTGPTGPYNSYGVKN